MEDIKGKVKIRETKLEFTLSDGTEETWGISRVPTYEPGTQFMRFRGEIFFPK